MLGERLAHYRILERIGEGGMGEVFKAEDLKLLRLVALKVLRGGTGDERHARLQHEARAASALSHPNIATIYEIGEGERAGQRMSFIAMEYVAGSRLTDAAAASADGVPGVLRLVKDVANALDEAHRSGVIHRDIKPSNVLVTNGGRVKVLDFGIAMYCPAADASRETWSGPLAGAKGAKGADGEVAGTVSYMSPEQLLGRDLDARTDVFSLGVVLYELLAKRLPFEGATLGATFDALLHAEPTPLPALTGTVDAELWRVVRRMLEKERERRYPTMRDVELDLCAVLRGDAVARSAPLERSVAVMGFTNITGSPEDEWLATAIAETVTADLKELGGVAVFGNERVHEVLRRLRSGHTVLDERLAIEAGREMGARWIVTGGFQRVGEQLRITARFLEVATGEVLRTVKIDGPTADLFALQDRVARELAQGLPVLVSPVAPVEAPEETTVLPAYEAYTKGVYNRRIAGRDSLERAILFFERAVSLDPLYLRAQVALAMAYDDKGQDLSADEPVEKAVAIFQRVLARDPSRSEAWRGYASALGYLGRDAEALAAVQRALALRPEDARVHASYARILFLGQARFAEAAAELEIALRLNPQAGWAALQLVHCYTLMGELGMAEAMARRAVDLQRQLVSGKEGFLIVGAHTRLGYVLVLQGRFEAAQEEYQEEALFLARVEHVLRQRARIELDARLGELLQKLGRDEESRVHLRRAVTSFEERLAMGADEPFTRYYAALALALLGERNRALEFLEEAAKKRRRFTVARSLVEPGLAEVRSEPRFAAFAALAKDA